MINIFIDTNIYIKLLTNPDESRYFDELKVLVKDKVVKLLVTEIVILELAKQNKTAKHNFQNELSRLQVNIKETSKTLWSEVREIESKINTLITEERKNKEEMWDRNYNALVEYLTSEYVNYIEFTPIIMCSGEKRKISGRLVRVNDNSSQDAYNIESLISCLKLLEESESKELIICTNDIKDFSKGKKVDGGFYKLHPIFETDFKNAKCVNSFKNLMKYVNYGYEYIDRESIDCREIDELNKISNYMDEEEYAERYVNANSIYLENLNQVFMKKINYTHKDLAKHRQVVIEDIHELLNQCRDTKGWGNKSELKLYSYLESRTEDYISISKLSDLIIIRENLKKYLKIDLV
ncbi:hypothetical protein SH2C18_04450 [Clostridium sediminicola]|uniref:PIN domain-containing protein n=1 Tax=Clostridium sediminicola TaxID=3114879 RepID=UPI0031F23A7A